MKHTAVPLTIIGLVVICILGWREFQKPSRLHTLRGQLVDIKGVPLAGAEIRYLHMIRGPEIFVKNVEEENRLMRTDIGGRFELACRFSVAQIDAVVLNSGQKFPYPGKVIQILNALPAVPLAPSKRGCDPTSDKPFIVTLGPEFAY